MLRGDALLAVCVLAAGFLILRRLRWHSDDGGPIDPRDDRADGSGHHSHPPDHAGGDFADRS